MYDLDHTDGGRNQKGGQTATDIPRYDLWLKTPQWLLVFVKICLRVAMLTYRYAYVSLCLLIAMLTYRYAYVSLCLRTAML